MSKIIIPKKQIVEASWNQHLPHPLRKGEKVIVDADQSNVNEGYIKVRHGKGEAHSIFSKEHFTDLKGRAI